MPGWYLVEETLESVMSTFFSSENVFLFQTTYSDFLDCSILNKNLFQAYHCHKMLVLFPEIKKQIFCWIYDFYFLCFCAPEMTFCFGILVIILVFWLLFPFLTECNLDMLTSLAE